MKTLHTRLALVAFVSAAASVASAQPPAAGEKQPPTPNGLIRPASTATPGADYRLGAGDKLRV